ncbi:hypothetical protein L3X37_15120 [Sabulilitoribacter arenilitoris]|uniref:Uncharacterized protein n=1 Tax=Wocania arenilitoris TaxID=2044858 RepID=A0AAE3JMT6_9FLAO|nr:hypothetical protein [Wocania arenilitoris]MCF7569677.1 hypothetical protein [Wocania arenilitoris]
MNVISRIIVPIIAIAIAIFIIMNGELTYDNLANELFGAILFTFMFFLVQNVFSPQLKISTKIAKYKLKKKKSDYFFKFINLSFSSIKEVKISVKATQLMDVPNGTNKIIRELPIDTDYIESVSGIFSSFRKENRNNTYLIKLPREIGKILSDHSQSIEIRMSCRDSVVGRERTFRRIFYHANTIEGTFKYGLSMKIE